MFVELTGQHHNICTVELPLTSEALTSYSYNFLKLTQPDDEQYKAVEKAIRQQSSSKWWREEHYSRLTASNFGRVILCQSNYAKLAEEILFTKLSDFVLSLKWDRLHESNAFSQNLPEQKNVYKIGFLLMSQACLVQAQMVLLKDQIAETLLRLDVLTVSGIWRYKRHAPK